MVSWKWAWLWVSLFAAVSSWVVVRKSRDEAPVRAPVAHARVDAKLDRDVSNVTATRAVVPAPRPSPRTESATATAPYALEYLRILHEKQAVESFPPSNLPDTRNVVIGDVTNARWGTPEMTAPGSFAAPHGLALDSKNDLYVSEVTWTFAVSRGRAPEDTHTFQKFRLDA